MTFRSRNLRYITLALFEYLRVFDRVSDRALGREQRAGMLASSKFHVKGRSPESVSIEGGMEPHAGML